MSASQSHIVYKVGIIFSQILLHYEHNFSTFAETLYACRVKIYAAASELYTHVVFQVVVFRKTAYSGCIFQGSKIKESEGAKLGLYGGRGTAN